MPDLWNFYLKIFDINLIYFVLNSACEKNHPNNKFCCRDLDSNCESWSKAGECEKNPNYMLSNCKKSCSIDLDSKCESWSKAGECEKNPNYMLSNCKKSCNVCN